MHGFSTVDGFVEITECLAEMIKYVANEPSVGLFYVQQHTQSAIPNVVSLKNSVAEKSRETALHTEDSEDSIVMLRSMKQCGIPVADEMIEDIRKSLAILATKRPKRGLIRASGSGYHHMGRAGSWAPATWGTNGAYSSQDSATMTSYFSTVFKSAKEKATNFKWPQLESKELTVVQGEKSYYPSQMVASPSTSSMPEADVESDELPLSSQAADELQAEEEDKQADASSPPKDLSLLENYDDFKADKQAKLEEWLGGDGDNLNKLQESK